MKKTLLLMTALGALSVSGVKAETLLGWNFAGEHGLNQQVAANTLGTGILDSLIAGGPDAPISDTGSGDGFFSTGWSTDGIALTDTAYFEFTITADVGYTLALSSLNSTTTGDGFFTFNGGGAAFAWAYKAAGQSEFTLLPVIPFSGSAGFFDVNYDLSAISSLQNTTEVSFRFYANRSSDSFSSFGKAWGIAGSGSSDTLTVNGTATTTPVPEPHEWAVLMGLTLGGIVLLRIRRRAMAS